MLDIILNIVHLVESLEEFLGLFFLRNGGEGYDDLLGEYLPSQPIDSPNLPHLCLLGMKPQLLAPLSNLVPMIAIHWSRLHGGNSNQFSVSYTQSCTVGSPFLGALTSYEHSDHPSLA